MAGIATGYVILFQFS